MSLNEDVVEHILDSYDHWWPRDLCRLSLVASIWLKPARKRLYACPTLSSYRSCHLLALTLERNPTLAAFVRKLDMRPKYDESCPFEEADRHIAGLCRGVPRLLALTCLEKLTIGGHLAFDAVRFLYTIGSPQTIKSLRIVCLTDRDRLLPTPALITWNGELALRFHALEVLKLEGPVVLTVDDMHYNPDAKLRSNVGVFPHGCMLKELCLSGFEIEDDSGPLCALLHEPASWRQLRSLTFTMQDSTRHNMENFFSLLALVHESLEHLVFRSSTDVSELITDLDEKLKPIPPFRRLRSLDTSYELIRDPDLSIARSLIVNMEMLDVYGRFNLGHVHGWNRHIMDNGFPRLKSLTLHLHESSIRKPAFHLLARLVITCYDRSILFQGLSR